MQKQFTFWTMILGLVGSFGLHCGSDNDAPETNDTGADSSTVIDTGSDSDSFLDTDANSDEECVPARCCHPSSCVGKANEPDCGGVDCDASCEPGTLDCGQGFCDFVGGECTAVFPSEMSCDERRNKAYAEVRAVLSENLDCEENGDCTIANGGTDCMGGCPVAVSKSGLQAYNDALAAANYKYCATFEEDGCDYLSPGCLPEVPQCVEKKCDMVPE